MATARLVANDVAGIDVNMGCPKPFSLKGGMGAALLRAPDTAHAILTALVASLPNTPITCKIRLLGTEEETLALVRRLVSTGIAAIGVHGRVQTQRPREPVSEEQIAMIRKVGTPFLPVLAGSILVLNVDLKVGVWGILWQDALRWLVVVAVFRHGQSEQGGGRLCFYPRYRACVGPRTEHSR